MKKLLLLILSITFLFAEPKTFSAAKKELRKLYPTGKTFYCGCDYKFVGKKSYIDFELCGYSPRNPLTKKGKKNQRVS